MEPLSNRHNYSEKADKYGLGGMQECRVHSLTRSITGSSDGMWTISEETGHSPVLTKMGGSAHTLTRELGPCGI